MGSGKFDNIHVTCFARLNTSSLEKAAAPLPPLKPHDAALALPSVTGEG
jgi:hypothetical protein